ncbi:MAG: cyclic-di-AMP receptor [Lachnospiraceae bacterium]|nr:cyclic-di-AMP receptor [Lachnospiraceae bacterium]
MKLVYIIVRQDNESDVVSALIKEKFMITKLSTSGGFLRRGNTTLFSCVEDKDVDRAIEIVRAECGERQKIQVDMPVNLPSTAINYTTIPTTIEVGGATIIVTDVARFEKF